MPSLRRTTNRPPAIRARRLRMALRPLVAHSPSSDAQDRSSRPAGKAHLRLAGAVEAGRDLPPDRIAPVAETGSCNERPRQPTAQHAVAVAQERQRVLTVRECTKARIRPETTALEPTASPHPTKTAATIAISALTRPPSSTHTPTATSECGQTRLRGQEASRAASASRSTSRSP